MNEEQQKNNEEFENKLREALKEQYDKGVAVGSAAIAQLVIQKLSDRTRTLAQRIQDVREVCAIPVRNMRKGE